eukprot:1049887-Karenia_brevis.AAC.1
MELFQRRSCEGFAEGPQKAFQRPGRRPCRRPSEGIAPLDGSLLKAFRMPSEGLPQGLPKAF